MTSETRPRGQVPVWVYVAALIAISLAARVPQLRSPNLLLDGDECVLGLMAKHLLDARDVPLFFWGQRYGLSSIEALTGATFFAVLGTSAVALKLAMLTLWTIGVLFLFLALSALVTAPRAFWIICVFLVSPAWAVWSMKARGGYLTSFTASAALLWLVVDSRRRDFAGRWLLAGTLTAIAYFAQPLWLTGVLPIVIGVLASRRRVAPAVQYASAAIAPVLFVTLALSNTANGWSGPALGNPVPWGALHRVAQEIYVNLTGAYYLAWAIDPPGRATATEGAVWCALLLVVVLLQLYRVATGRFHRWSHLFFLGLSLTLVTNWLLLFARDARYLLPLSGLLIPLVGIEVVDLVDRRLLPKSVAVGLTAIALILGSVSMLEFRAFSFLWTNPPGSWSESRRLQQVINALQSRGVSRVYSMNGLLDTQLIFYSNEQVISRWASEADRHPAYVREVNRALEDGEKVAVVGYTDASGAPGCWDAPICTGGIEGLVPDPEAIFTVDHKYFVYVGATKALLRQLRFDISR